ncbi:uncharacterized protein LOC117648563 isoform X2 [Thrips palmi]|uniref:Uncharacterized protein LOC117648563 isoform X2 n=1 Tax=Thrips palmi TaxID=161013 RepID=A0A6P8Z990_THRPL|nr:uncharacterized protein LOC117648563 isoform X2 [Thrips palmi]
MMMENNNKESFKLLSVVGSGSDSESEVPEFVLTPKKKRLKRRVRANHSITRTRDPNATVTCGRKSISLVLAAVFLFCWLCTLSWLTVLLHGNIQQLDEMVGRVVAGSQAVPDDLQKIHSLSRELQQNQTQLTLRVNTIAAQISNLSQQLGVVQTDLRVYTDHHQSNPEPSNIKELMTNVALMGSQIKDLDNTVRSVKQQQTTLDSILQTVGKNLTAVETSVSQLSNATLRPTPLEPNIVHELESLRQVVAQTSANISAANSTMTKRLQWLQDDQVKDHKAIELLQDLGQNVTARVKTLEGECAKISEQSMLNSTLTVLKEQVNQDAQRLKAVEHYLSTMPASPEQPALQVTPSSIVAGKPAESGSIAKEEPKREGLTPLLTESGITTPGG